MNTLYRLCFIGKWLIIVGLASVLSACPLNVNLNVTTDKPIALYLMIDKPIAVKLDADLAVSKLPALQAKGNIAITKLPPLEIKP
jgi:hypothetical protein